MLPMDYYIGLGIVAVILLIAFAGIFIFIKSIIDNKAYDEERLPDMDELDVEEFQLPDLALEDSTFAIDLAVDEVKEASAASLLAEFDKHS